MNGVRWLAIVFFILTLSAFPGSRQSLGQGSSTTPSAAWPALRDSVEHMHTAMMSVEPSVNADVDFVRLMVPHHQAAIDIAKAPIDVWNRSADAAPCAGDHHRSAI